MAKSSFSRRDFLKLSAASSSAWALSSCASVDSFFMGNRRDLKNEVVILGAGAAGLAAAFNLKKKKIPFRIFEASGRVGGRVQSIQVFAREGPVAELGAEFFESSHTQIWDLAKELNLPIKELRSGENLESHLFSLDNRVYRPRDLQNKMRTLQNVLKRVRTDLFRDQDVILSYKNSVQFERSSYYDSLSLRDLLNSWKGEVDPLILQLIEVQAVNRYGVDAEEQSSLHFLSTVDAEGSSLLSGTALYRLEGGLSSLMQTLVARVAGVIPDYIVRMNSPLIEISEEGGVFELTFKTERGEETFKTSRVICTLPFSKLREVKGLAKMGFSNLKKSNIFNQDYATHAKGFITFGAPFWRNTYGTTSANLGNFTGNFTTQKVWDSGRTEEEGPKKLPGLLVYQRGGSSGAKAGAAAAEQALKDLGLFYKEMPSSISSGIVNWQQRPWAAGSMAVYKPGQYMKFRGVAGEAEYNGHFVFAGEHTSLRYAGSLQGALESGLRAASEVSL